MSGFINRESAEALIREQISDSIFQDTPKQSIFMTLAKRLPNMTSNQTRIPVLDMLPMAYWVNGENDYKQTSKQAWENVYLNTAELAVIVPIPEAVVNDSDFDIVGEVAPRVMEAIGKCIDEAAIFGINKPVNWPMDIVTAARNSQNVINPYGTLDFYDLIMGEEGVLSFVEQDGYMSTAAIGSLGIRSKLRALRDTTGQPIFTPSMQGASQYVLDGAPIYFPQNGSFPSDKVHLVVGDWSQAVYSIRQDISVKILDQGIIQNPITKEIEYNLAQQDMIALRVVFRMGWALPNPATRINSDRLGCPFAFIEHGLPSTLKALSIVVRDSEGDVIEGAEVNLDGSRLITNGSGTAVFSVEGNLYKYTIKLDGYKTLRGEAEVDSISTVKNVILTKA